MYIEPPTLGEWTIIIVGSVIIAFIAFLIKSHLYGKKIDKAHKAAGLETSKERIARQNVKALKNYTAKKKPESQQAKENVKNWFIYAMLLVAFIIYLAFAAASVNQ